MVTGDHLRTALSVAHAAGMLPPTSPTLLLDADSANHLQGRVLQPNGVTAAMSTSELRAALTEGDTYPVTLTGPAWQTLVTDAGAQAMLWQVVARGVVFARMAPDDKRQVVEALTHGEAASIHIFDHSQTHSHVANLCDSYNDVTVLVRKPARAALISTYARCVANVCQAYTQAPLGGCLKGAAVWRFAATVPTTWRRSRLLLWAYRCVRLTLQWQRPSPVRCRLWRVSSRCVCVSGVGA